MHDPADGVSFGALLRLHRRKLGLTQEALAEQASFSVEYVKKLEGGSRRPSHASADAFVAALGLEGEEAQALRAARLSLGVSGGYPAPALTRPDRLPAALSTDGDIVSSNMRLWQSPRVDPSVEKTQPAMEKTQPAIEKNQPAMEKPQPAMEEPQPAVEIPPSSARKVAEPAAAVIEEERRLVTALFCDLVGFTPMAEDMDPEDIRDIQGVYFPAMKRQIERYGGTVEKYAGDAILALFGIPLAHEDDAERAVLCGLGMHEVMERVAEKTRERWDVAPTIRVGVNTGEVVSGARSGTGWADVGVSGDAINTAARLQGAAEPGQVLAGQETMWLTSRRIRYGNERGLYLKGKSAAFPCVPGARYSRDCTKTLGRRLGLADGGAEP